MAEAAAPVRAPSTARSVLWFLVVGGSAAEVTSALPLTNDDTNTTPVFFGGPVQPDRGFVLHKPIGNWQSTLTITDDLALSTSKDILAAVADGRGPDKLQISLGYAGWEKGQLEEEIAANSWLTVAAEDWVIFDTPVEERYTCAIKLLGFDPALLSSVSGHA